MSPTPQITRHRFDTRRRQLTVLRVETLTPAMRRITLHGPDLADFQSLGADDHVKLFFPATEPSGSTKPQMRDYTPRAYSQTDQTLVLDFALHEAGPATAWAMQAQPGDGLEIGGPRGSAVVTGFDWYLLIGDETALPAIGRRAEELGGENVITLVAVTGPEEEQYFPARAAHWVHRPADAADAPEPLLAALREITLPQGAGFVWIGAEAKVARALRDHVLGPMAHPKTWLKASGYWARGQADGSVKFED
jgi:NADPH-dependent ferric siderophore reductase